MDAFLKKGYLVKAFVHSTKQTSKINERICIFSGDLTSSLDLSQAMEGVTAIYHICPNMHPAEVAIGRHMIRLARLNGIHHFVYHSVLHPQIREMPHHWKKMRVEGLLFKSGLNFTILQPTAYMQNLLAYKPAIMSDGVYAVPYNGQTRISMVDVRDVAEVAAGIILNEDHYGSTYELADDDICSQLELAGKFSAACRRVIAFREIPRDEWRHTMVQSSMPAYSIDALLRMFEYYERFGFIGNGIVLKALLGHNGRSLDAFIEEFFSE